MRKYILQHVILAISFLAAFGSQGQKKFDLSISEASFNIAGKSLVGYRTKFDFSREEVRLGWWKYARRFGNPLDMRTHYEVTIPADATDGNVDLIIFSETTGSAEQATISIGLTEKKYKAQVEELIKEFKKDFYIQFYLSLLSKKEAEAQEYANQYEDEVMEEERAKYLDLLNEARTEMERLMLEIRAVEAGS